MSSPTRRTVLVVAGLGTTSLAGCAGDSTQNPGNGNDSDDGADIEIYQLGHRTTFPRWDEYLDAPGIVEIFDDKNSLVRRLYDLDIDTGDDDSAPEIPSASDDDEFLIFVQTVWPDGCAVELVAEGLTVDDGTLTGSIVSEYVDEDPDACPAVVTYPSAVIHVDGATIDDVSLEITDGWGETGDVTPADWSIDPEHLPGYVTPSGDPPAVPEQLTCPDDDFERLDERDTPVAIGEGVDASDRVIWALRADHADTDTDSDPLVFEYGETIEIQLHNMTPFVAETGNRRKVGIEVETADGWQEVRGVSDDASYGWTDEAVIHEPGDGFTWGFELTEKGIVASDDALEVCPDLPAGRYRFFIWDLLGIDTDLGIEFDFVERD